MRLYIHQRGWTYKIYKDTTENLVYTAEVLSSWRKWKQWVEFRDTEQNLIAELGDNSKGWFKLAWNVRYLVQHFSSGRNYEIFCVKFRHDHWQMTDGQTTYDYYGHLGHQKSIFRNGVQVAKADKKMVSYFGRDSFIIDCNRDEDIVLLCALVLNFDIGNSDDGATVSLDIGRLGPQEREFDVNWRPA